VVAAAQLAVDTAIAEQVIGENEQLMSGSDDRLLDPSFGGPAQKKSL